MPARPILQDFREGEDVPLVALVTLPDGTTPLLTSHVKAAAGANTGFDLYVFPVGALSQETAAYSTLSQNPAATTFNPDSRAVLTNTLSTDLFWTKNATGYNVRLFLRDASFAPTGGRLYLVELVFHTTSYGKIVQRWELTCRSTVAPV